jgi:hypothetical protein
MKTNLFTRIMLTLIATILAIHLFMDFKPTIVNAQGPVKMVTVQEYSSGPILGFSCLTNSSGSACFILTR